MTTGIYDYRGGATYTNSPASGTYGILEVIKSNEYVLQRSVNVVTGVVKIRTTYDNGTSWGSWV